MCCDLTFVLSRLSSCNTQGRVLVSQRVGFINITASVTSALLNGRSRDRFPVVSLDFSLTYSFRPYNGPGVDSAPSENEYQEHFLGVKVPSA